MNHIFIRRLGYLCLLGSVAFVASAADQTWMGEISDSQCGATHDQMIAGKYKELRSSSGAPSRDCTLACIKGGSKYVFVMKGKGYNIANQNFAGLQVHAGETVRLTGEMKGDTITVSEVAMPPKK
jgi:hypothetical protein